MTPRRAGDVKVVVDASVAVKWVVEEEGTAAAVALAEQPLMAPDLLITECANVLWAKARRQELTAEEVRERIGVLAAAPVTLVPQAELVADAVDLALRIAHPVYDCLYLALARREGGVVVTADRRFLAAVGRDEELAKSVEPLV